MNHDDMTVSLPINGRIIRFPARVAALAIGVPHENLITELRRNGGDFSKLPEDWKRNARRRAAETAAKLNDDSIMAGLRHYRDNPDA